MALLVGAIIWITFSVIRVPGKASVSCLRRRHTEVQYGTYAIFVWWRIFTFTVVFAEVQQYYSEQQVSTLGAI